MPAVSLLTKNSTFDPCGAPPRPPSEASSNVFAENIAIHREGDSWVLHACGVVLHGAVTVSGSPTVFVNNKPMARIGDLISCGSTIAEGASTVLCEDESSIIQGVTILNDQLSRKNVNKLADGYREWSGTTVVNIVPGLGLEIVDDEYETSDGYRDLYPPAPQISPPDPIPPGEIAESAPDNGPAYVPPVLTDCSMISLPLDYNTQLTPNFQLKQLSISAVFQHSIKAQHGLTQEEIVCNLKSLCENILEPLWAQYPGFRINSGFRTSNGGNSHHHLGWAADLQWSSFSYDDYFIVAEWIQSNFQLTQLLLEHGNRPWLHVSYNASDIRSVGNPRRVMTMYRGKFTSGLHKITGYS